MYYLRNYILAVVTILTVIACAMPGFVWADAPKKVQLSPAVIDEKVKQRDIIKESVTIKNIWDRPMTLFPAVEDVNPENGDQQYAIGRNAEERKDSLANWIELSRAVIELAPGEEKTVAFVIHVNMNAVPGTYHAAITFVNGGTRDETLNRAPDGVLTVNVEVLADVKEDLQILKFATDRIAFTGDDVMFKYRLENIGNQDLIPSGDIRIYDRRGEEVATIEVNKEGKAINPEKISQLASVWSAVSGFGQFKALITINYGKGQLASVQDTIFFWIIPWKQILGLATATLIAMVILALYFRQWFEERHLNKLAMAGLLKTNAAVAAAAFIPTFPAVLAEAVRPINKKEPAPENKKAAEEQKERLVVRIAENIVIAWQLFTTFKRSGRLTAHDIEQRKIMPTPVPTQKTTPKDAISHKIEGVETQWHSWRPPETKHGDTVDLKKIRSAPGEAIHQGHVVDLKKRI